MKQKNIVLMVVAVGCGLVAAVLTSQMSAKGGDQVEVIVAAKELPVNTVISKDDVSKLTKRKKVAKDAVLPGAVESEDELIDKRLSRPMRAEEIINKGDLSKGIVVNIPTGMQMFTLPIGSAQAVAGFVNPGCRVDVLGTVRLGNTLKALPILVNMLVLAVDTATTAQKEGNGAFPTLNSVSFAVDRKQALLLELAKARGCSVSLLLRNQEEEKNENDKKYNIDEVVKLLQNGSEQSELIPGHDEVKTKPKVEDPKIETPAPKADTVKVRVATEDIKAGTEITTDLLTEKFKDIELPKELADGAITDPGKLHGKFLKSGLGKGQWVTRSLIGEAELKPSPQEPDSLPKPGPLVENPKAGPVAPGKRKSHDVSLHTPSGTKVYRYEEVKPGEWKLVGEVTPADRAEETPAPTPAPPKPEKKFD